MASTLKELKAIAEELNEKLELAPAIDIETTNVKQLEKRILVGLKNDDTGKIELYTTDKATLSEETWKYLTEDLEIIPEVPAEEESGEDKKQPEATKGEEARKEAPAEKPKKAAKQTTAMKGETERKPKVGKKAQDNIIPRTIELVTEGTYTRKELQKKLEGEFPNRSAGSITAILSDSKNEKYTRLGKTAKESADGKMSF